MGKNLRLDDAQYGALLTKRAKWQAKGVKEAKVALVEDGQVGAFVALHKTKDTKQKKNTIKTMVPTEHQEQVAVIQWCDAQTGEFEKARHIFAIPNGSHKSPAGAAKFKREGLRAGVPDLFLPCHSNGFHGLFLEMKRVKGSKLSEVQLNEIGRLQNSGYSVSVCYGAAEAIEAIKNYLTKA